MKAKENKYIRLHDPDMRSCFEILTALWKTVKNIVNIKFFVAIFGEIS